MRGSSSRFDRIRESSALYPGVAATLGPDFPWHTRAGHARSSQTFCLSAWIPLVQLEARHRAIEGALAAAGGPLPAHGERRWTIAVEAARPDLLGETAGRATVVDVLLTANDAVVCVESKYLSDAQHGLDGCREFPGRCRGFHGPGSDRETGTDAACRLERAEIGGRGRAAANDAAGGGKASGDGASATASFGRAADDAAAGGGAAGGGASCGGRFGAVAAAETHGAPHYWQVAARLCADAALTLQGPGEKCPLRGCHQLARTLFFAAEYARTTRRPWFAAVVAVPAAAAARVEQQVEAFAAGVVRPEYAGLVSVLHYERLVELLAESGEEAAVNLSRFLAARLPVAPVATPRTETVRELRRRAEAQRRARRTAT